jgi:hypothetical protein
VLVLVLVLERETREKWRNRVVEYWSDFAFRLRRCRARGLRLVAVEDEDDDEYEDENVTRQPARPYEPVR